MMKLCHAQRYSAEDGTFLPLHALVLLSTGNDVYHLGTENAVYSRKVPEYSFMKNDLNDSTVLGMVLNDATVVSYGEEHYEVASEEDVQIQHASALVLAVLPQLCLWRDQK